MAFQQPPREYSQQEFMRILTEFDQRLTDLERALNIDRYQLNNVTLTRTFDPTTATLADTAQTLGTLLTDLQRRGRIA